MDTEKTAIGAGESSPAPDGSADSETDLCLECGREVPSKLWGGGCHDTVHQIPCMKCGRRCGVITDDDYCGPEKMVCPDCMDKARKKHTQNKVIES